MKAQVKKGLPGCQRLRIKFPHVQAGLAKLREVPVVLNMISDFEMTPVEMKQKPLQWFGLGACLPVPDAAATPASKGTGAFGRPSAPVAGLGQHFALTVSGQAARNAAKSSAAKGAAANGSAASDQQSAYNMTLTIAEGAGDLGPHPAREPV